MDTERESGEIEIETHPVSEWNLCEEIVPTLSTEDVVLFSHPHLHIESRADIHTDKGSGCQAQSGKSGNLGRETDTHHTEQSLRDIVGEYGFPILGDIDNLTLLYQQVPFEIDTENSGAKLATGSPIVDIDHRGILQSRSNRIELELADRTEAEGKHVAGKENRRQKEE